MGNLISLSEVTGHGTLRSPAQALDDAKQSTDGAFANGKKVLIIALDDSEGKYDVSFIQAGLHMSECLSLTEIAKDMFKQEMGF